MDSGEWFASIPGFDGLWVTGSTGEEARKELLEALEGWITVHTRDGKNPLPEIDGITPDDFPEEFIKTSLRWLVSVLAHGGNLYGS